MLKRLGPPEERSQKPKRACLKTSRKTVNPLRGVSTNIGNPSPTLNHKFWAPCGGGSLFSVVAKLRAISIDGLRLKLQLQSKPSSALNPTETLQKSYMKTHPHPTSERDSTAAVRTW